MASCINTVFMDCSYMTGYFLLTASSSKISGHWDRMFRAVSSITYEWKEENLGMHNNVFTDGGLLEHKCLKLLFLTHKDVFHLCLLWGRHPPFEVKLAKINTYLPKLSSPNWPLNEWSKPLCLTNTPASNYKESKHQFVLIVKPWSQRPHWL